VALKTLVSCGVFVHSHRAKKKHNSHDATKISADRKKNAATAQKINKIATAQTQKAVR